MTNYGQYSMQNPDSAYSAERLFGQGAGLWITAAGTVGQAVAGLGGGFKQMSQLRSIGGTIQKLGTALNLGGAAASTGMAVSDIRKNGFTVQNTVQLLSGGMNLAGAGAAARGYQSFSQVAGKAGTWLGRGTNVAGIGVNAYDMAVNGITAENTSALMQNVVGLTGTRWACFSGRTKLLVRSKGKKGYKRIDEITLEDEVASRNEFDPNGAIVSPTKFWSHL